MNTLAHGQARAGLVTASIASVIMRGGQGAWDTLSKKLWADDGTEFAAPVGGARQHGHVMEKVGSAKWWADNPEYDLEAGEFIEYAGRRQRWRGHLGISPDGRIVDTTSRKMLKGLEVKSPVEYEKYCLLRDEMLRTAEPPDEHRDQVYFSIMVARIPWVYLVHSTSEGHEDEYAAMEFPLDNLSTTGWFDRFEPRLDAFLKFHHEGAAPVRRALPAKELKKLSI